MFFLSLLACFALLGLEHYYIPPLLSGVYLLFAVRMQRVSKENELNVILFNHVMIIVHCFSIKVQSFILLCIHFYMDVIIWFGNFTKTQKCEVRSLSYLQSVIILELRSFSDSLDSP